VHYVHETTALYIGLQYVWRTNKATCWLHRHRLDWISSRAVHSPAWNFTLTPTYVFMVWCLSTRYLFMKWYFVKHRTIVPLPAVYCPQHKTITNARNMRRNCEACYPSSASICTHVKSAGNYELVIIQFSDSFLCMVSSSTYLEHVKFSWNIHKVLHRHHVFYRSIHKDVLKWSVGMFMIYLQKNFIL